VKAVLIERLEEHRSAQSNSKMTVDTHNLPADNLAACPSETSTVPIANTPKSDEKLSVSDVVVVIDSSTIIDSNLAPFDAQREKMITASLQDAATAESSVNKEQLITNDAARVSIADRVSLVFGDEARFSDALISESPSGARHDVAHPLVSPIAAEHVNDDSSDVRDSEHNNTSRRTSVSVMTHQSTSVDAPLASRNTDITSSSFALSLSCTTPILKTIADNTCAHAITDNSSVHDYTDNSAHEDTATLIAPTPFKASLSVSECAHDLTADLLTDTPTQQHHSDASETSGNDVSVGTAPVSTMQSVCTPSTPTQCTGVDDDAATRTINLSVSIATQEHIVASSSVCDNDVSSASTTVNDITSDATQTRQQSVDRATVDADADATPTPTQTSTSPKAVLSMTTPKAVLLTQSFASALTVGTRVELIVSNKIATGSVRVLCDVIMWLP
jgi:hypothetical protein